MYIVGLDIGKINSHVSVGDSEGKVLDARRIKTSRASFEKYFLPFTPSRVLIEASTDSEAIARLLESIGQTVIVGDPRFAPMYAHFDRHIKNDKRDADGLRVANLVGAYRPAHRRSDENRDLRARLLVRAGLVKTRTRCVVQARSLLQSRGLIVGSCDVEEFSAKLESEGGLPAELGLGEVMLPLFDEIISLNKTIAELDKELEAIAREHDVAARLDRVVGVGALTALAFVSAIDDTKRFKSSKQVASFFGFVPGENSTGKREQFRLSSTRTGDTLTRGYIIQASWSLLRSKRPQVAPLREWALRIAARRGKKVAVNALARRLVRILFAIWRDGTQFDVSRLQQQPTPPAATTTVDGK